MKMKMKKFKVLLVLCLLCSCEKNVLYNPVTYQVNSIIKDGNFLTPFNTSISVKFPNKIVADSLFDKFCDNIWDYHYLTDSHYSYENITNINYINNHLNEEIKISSDLYRIIDCGIKLTKLTKGKFNIALGSVISYWEEIFNSSEVVQIDENTINELMLSVPNYEIIDEVIILNNENNTIKINNALLDGKDIKLSIGSLAKGFALDNLSKEIYEESLLINMGGSSIITTGENPNPYNKDWKIAIENPLDKSGDYLTTIKFNGTYSLSTSGDYIRYVELNKDGEKIKYHHILDGLTGYSNSYHHLVNVISSDTNVSMYLDALSTCIMNIANIQEINEFIESFKLVFNINNIEYLIMDDEIIYSEGYQKFIE